MKYLLFGKGGQLGWELQRALAPLGEVVALDFDSQAGCGDFTNLAGLAQTIQAVQPDVIVNAAAHTAVDKAESEAELARTINALAPGVLAEEAKKLGAWLVHYSTDYVFDGSGERPWHETDTPAPLSVYGRTKLEGEELIAQSGCQHLIFRTSWVYATRGGNFGKTILRLAKEREQLKIINDQIGAPTGAELLADVSAHAIRRALVCPELSGLYHCTAAGETNWYEYARLVFDQARQAGIALKLQSALPIPSTEYPLPAPRPLNSRLDCSKLESAFALRLPDWRIGVTRMLDEVLSYEERAS